MGLFLVFFAESEGFEPPRTSVSQSNQTTIVTSVLHHFQANSPNYQYLLALRKVRDSNPRQHAETFSH